MLRLEKLELIGFKSFYSRTEFNFDRNITAVVGPNGCGKSNIGDALNWVIGEQSVKSLRGDRMEDVIFNGSEGRRPLGMAEVSLHLKNGAVEGEPGKIVITRRLFRSGESEYLINGARARLRDLQEALERVNVGSGVYAIIEQGKVDAALSSRPRERRALIEEAAGIALYKTRKRQAEAKLEATEANLLRVNDIIVELERQIGSLKRQAAKARRLTRTMDEIERQERILLHHDHGRFERERIEVSSREEEARARESEAAGRLATLEALHEEARRLLEEQDFAWRARREELYGLDRELDRHERERTLARQQAEEAGSAARAAREQAALLSRRLEEGARQIEARRVERERIEQEVAGQEAERTRIEESRRVLEDRIETLERNLAGRRTAFLQAVDALSDTRNRRRQIEEAREKAGRRAGALDREGELALSRLDESIRARRLVEVERQRIEAEDASCRTALSARRDDQERLAAAAARESARREEARQKVHGFEQRLATLEEIEASGSTARDLLEGLVAHDGILSDELKVPAHLEGAVEIYLEAYLGAALVHDTPAALEAVAALKRSGKGRAAFLSSADSADQPLIRLPEDVVSDSGFVGRLGDLVEAPRQRRPALAAALARTVVVTDLESARRLRRLAPFFDFLTLDGDVLHISGLVEGGARRPEGAGVLTRRRLMSDLQAAIQTGRAHVAGLEHLVVGLETDRQAAGADVSRLAEALAALERELATLGVKLEGSVDDEERARSGVATIDAERRSAREESDALALEFERLTATQGTLEEARRAGEEAIQSTQEEIANLRAGAASAGESVARIRAAVSASRQRLESFDNDLARLLEADQELRDRIESEASRAEELDRKRQRALGCEEASGAALRDLSQKRAGLEAAVREGEVSLSERRLDIERQAHALRDERTALEAARSAREQVTLEKERVAADLRHLVAGATEASGRTLEELFALVTDEEKAQDPHTVRQGLVELRESRDRMGPVNMMALDQFRELEERYGFLAAQRKDLTEAVASLKETIARINRTSRERFLDAFEKVRASFTEIYATLFGGGRADLKLLTGEGEEDVLECGMEIIAQPPGKRLQSVTLLSGGEKALTAIALLFAIFKYRPAPFCLLDEVDAPLDEANVIRFNDLLRTMATGTQFVMITHNRSSMEAADVLYGITMEEPGLSRTMSVVLDGDARRAETIRSLPAMLAGQHKGAGAGRRSALGRMAAGENGGGTAAPAGPTA